MTDFIEFSKSQHFKLESKDYWRCACLIDDNDDSRRHHVMLDECYNMLANNIIESCLSIGDSRARDAAYAKSRFNCHSIASDLNTSQLKQAVVDGFVDEVADIDVESIPFPSSSIDLVIAKESFHHWPRPMLGLYEMLRVARKCVALIEPNDCLPMHPTPYINVNQYEDSYEEVGNYLYRISPREILKVAWSLNLPAVSIKGFNDPYNPDQSFDEWIQQKEHLDSLGQRGERQFNLVAIIIHKHSESVPSDGGFVTYYRPPNPFSN